MIQHGAPFGKGLAAMTLTRTAMAQDNPPLFWGATFGFADLHTVFYLSDEGTAARVIVGIFQLYI